MGKIKEKLLPKGRKSNSFNLKDNLGEDIPTEGAAQHINEFFANVEKNLVDKIPNFQGEIPMDNVEK